VKSYDKIQEEIDAAFQQFFEQRERATEVLNRIANVLTNECGIPKTDLGFVESLDAPSEELIEKRERALNTGQWLPHAARVIQRDDKGTWRADICIRVDRPKQKSPIKLGQTLGSGKERLVVTVRLQVHFPGGSIAHVRVEDKSKAFEIDQPVNAAMLQTVAEEVLRKLDDMAEWLRTGKGKKPAIGFH